MIFEASIIQEVTADRFLMRTMPYRKEHGRHLVRATESKKPRHVYLKKSLGTQDRREPNRRAKHAADIDRTFRDADPRSSKAGRQGRLNDRHVHDVSNNLVAGTRSFARASPIRSGAGRLSFGRTGRTGRKFIDSAGTRHRRDICESQVHLRL